MSKIGNAPRNPADAPTTQPTVQPSAAKSTAAKGTAVKPGPAPGTTDVWESSEVGKCVTSANKRVCAESVQLEKQLRKATLLSRVCDTLLAGGFIGTFCTVVMGLAAPLFLPCAVLALTLGLVVRAELQDSRHDKELKLARKQGEVAMAHGFIEELRPMRLADALKAPAKPSAA